MMREPLARLFPAGSFARNISVLTGGSAFAQALTVLALPLLTRLYTPEDFEFLAVYVAIVALITVVSCLRYDIAVPLPEDDADGLALLMVALLAAAAISAMLALPVLLAPESISALLGQPEFQSYLWMVPVGVFFAAIYNAMQYWASRKKRFGLIARTRMTRALGGVGIQIGIGTVTSSPFGLMFGHMLSGGFGLLTFLRDLLQKDRSIIRTLHIPHIFHQARVHYRFPICSVPDALLNTAGVQLPLILIAAAAGPDAGLLMLAMRVMGLPLTLVGASVSQVFLAEAPARLRDGTLPSFTRRTMRYLLYGGLPPFVIVGLLAPTLFPLVFGPGWGRAGWFVMWMTPWFILQLVASPVSAVMYVLQRQDMMLALNLSGFGIRFGLTWTTILFFSNFAVHAYIVSSFLFYSICCTVILKLVGDIERRKLYAR